MILINSNTRQFNVPGADLVFGVVADSDAERKYFQCPRYVGDNLDLASCFIRINYRNANGKTDFYLVDDMAIEGDNITFSWLLSPKVTEYKGQVKFVLCAVGPDLKLKWHTTQGTGQVMDGLEPDNSHVESKTSDVVAQLISMVEAQTSAVEKVGADQVASVKANAKTAQDSAVTAIEAAGAAVKASIPTDYTALSDAMRKTAPGIVCHAEGEVITLNDASNQAFRGMRIFGKSTQDGTPTPENPVEIVSIGKSGSVFVSATGKNLLNNTAASSPDMNGVAFTVNADRSITANGTAKVDTYFVVNESAQICSGEYYLTGCPAGGSAMSYFLYISGLVQDFGSGVKSKLSGIYKVGICIKANATVSNLTFYPMIRLASVTEGNYEPYNGGTLTLSTPNRLPGIPVTSSGNYTDANGQQWICDEVDFERGMYVQRVKTKTFDGTESGWSYTGHGYSYERVELSLPDSEPSCIPMCNVFRGVGDATGWYGTDSVITIDSSQKMRVYRPSSAIQTVTDVDSWRAFLSDRYAAGTPLIALYTLATPIETHLSETEIAAYRALHTNKPNTTILNDSGAYMSVDYTADTKLYIDNKIKEALL